MPSTFCANSLLAACQAGDQDFLSAVSEQIRCAAALKTLDQSEHERMDLLAGLAEALVAEESEAAMLLLCHLAQSRAVPPVH